VVYPAHQAMDDESHGCHGFAPIIERWTTDLTDATDSRRSIRTDPLHPFHP
jgi:hypothetical protein